MIKYILQRILIFIPTLFAISLITFIISINAPGDPVETFLNSGAGGGGQGQTAGKGSDEKAYLSLRKDLGLDRPVFYMTVTNATVSDTLYKIPKKKVQANLQRLAYEYGDWSYVARYYLSIKKLQKELYRLKPNTENARALRKSKQVMFALLDSYKEAKVKKEFAKLEICSKESLAIARLKKHIGDLHHAYAEMRDNTAIINRYIPKLNFYGLNNQYHVWLFGDEPWLGTKDPTVYYSSRGFFRGDFGKSYLDKRPVSSKIWEAMKITFLMSLVSLFLTYLMALPLGIFTAVKKGKNAEKIVSTGLFMLYSLPSFWIGTMFVSFLCNPDFLNLFPPAYSLMNLSEDAGFWESFTAVTHHLALPMFCWTYGSLAYLSRQMRGGMLASFGQDYIRTARAKGLSEKRVIWKHAFRNSLIPVITIFASVFPLAISGSIVIEVIFSIPGMGKISLEAINARDYPVIYTVMMFTGILTLMGVLVSDMLYAVVDPRISYSHKK